MISFQIRQACSHCTLLPSLFFAVAPGAPLLGLFPSLLHSLLTMSDHGSDKVKTTSPDAVVTVHAIETQAGALKAEAVRRVWGPKSKICLYLG